VVEDIADGEASVAVGETRLALPKAVTAENANRTVMIPVDPEALEPDTELTFSVNDGNYAGYRVDVSSIVLEHRRELVERFD
jgi:hypothetical protein